MTFKVGICMGARHPYMHAIMHDVAIATWETCLELASAQISEEEDIDI